jgi:hypothetical protein
MDYAVQAPRTWCQYPPARGINMNTNSYTGQYGSGFEYFLADWRRLEAGVAVTRAWRMGC